MSEHEDNSPKRRIINVKSLKMADDIRLYESGSAHTVGNVRNNSSYGTEFDAELIDQINFDAEKENFKRVSIKGLNILRCNFFYLLR